MITGCDIKIHSDLTDVKKHPDIIRSEEEKIVAKNHIQELLDKKAIILSNREEGDFISTIFLVPKKNSVSKFQIILNYKEFNKYAVKSSFKMETSQHIITVVTPNMFMTNINIIDAYLVVPVNK